MTPPVAPSTSRGPCPGPTDLVGTQPARPPRLLAALASVGLSAILGILLTGCFSAPPQIISLEPNRGSTGVLADAPVRVIFDKSVQHTSTAGHFTVTPAIPGCNLATAFTAPPGAPCWIHWLDPQPGFELLHAGAVFRPLTRYVFTIEGGFTDPQGDRNGLDHHWDLTSAAAPSLSAASPGNGATDVALDAPLAVAFSAPMDAPSTAAAITLVPTVPGTTVVRNTTDHSRFVILPGQLLGAATHYTIDVAASARGEDEQALVRPAPIHFVSGARLGSPHAVVRAGLSGGNATEVLLAGLTPAAAGDPIAAPVLLSAPLCSAAAGCGAVAEGDPMVTYEAAAIAADGTHLAVVVDDDVSSSSQLEVIDTVHHTVTTSIADGVRPSWSPAGTQLALVSGADVEVLDVTSRSTRVIASGVGLSAAPLWAGTSTLVLSVAPGGGPGGIELVNLPVGARYVLPGAPPAATAAAVSPAGDRLAVVGADGATLVLPSLGASGTPQKLAGRLVPLGFAGEGALVAINSDANQLVRVSVAGSDSTVVGFGGVGPDLATVRVAPDGRRLVCLAPDLKGARQAFVANADGSGELAITRFLPGDVEAQSVDFAS
jgi:hypothetical protein